MCEMLCILIIILKIRYREQVHPLKIIQYTINFPPFLLKSLISFSLFLVSLFLSFYIMIESSSVHPLTRELDEKVDSVLDQLPTLDDVLYRHSQPPVCLYNYYIVLRDRLQLETWLDFWLDIAQADILYKRYIKYKKRPSKMQLKKPSIASSLFSSESPRHDILTHMLLLQPRTSLANTITTTGSNKRPPPTQTEMHETIERIYLRYIVPSAEKELVQLPFQIKQQIHQFFNSETPNEKDNPAVYAESKAYVHQVLESTFPLFLRYKVFMNLTLPQQIGRLALGLVCLLVGFSLEFSLIFLDVRPWQNRLWVK